jgi:hypothetical protein
MNTIACHFSHLFRFIYYFLNQQEEEELKLEESLRGDTLAQNRLSNLQSKLRREAASSLRILRMLKSSLLFKN